MMHFLLCLDQARLTGEGTMFSTYLFICLFICYQTCENNEPIMMPIGTSGPRGKGTK